MDIKQNPFSLYDFLGYFTPGAIALYLVLLVLGHLSPDHATTDYVREYLDVGKAENYLPFILAAYVTGHLVAFVSSITVERYAVWALGYPSKYLLDLKREGYFEAEDKQFIRGFFRILVWLALISFTVWDVLLGDKAGWRDLYARKLDKLLIAVLRKRVGSLVRRHAGIQDPGKYGAPIDHDFFRYVYHYALEHAPAHGPKMRNYVALYGFLRALALIAATLFWVAIFHFWVVAWSTALAMTLAASILAYLFFMGFVKFYTRFSLEALMAMAVTYETQPGVPADGSRPAGEPRR